MFNLVDLITLLIIGIATFLGYKRGFVKTSFRMLSFIIAIILSLLLYKPVASYIREKTNLSEWIIQTITKNENAEQDEKEIINIEINEEEKKNGNNSTVEIEETLINLPQNIKEYIGVDETINQAKEQIAQKIADTIINVMSLICVYLIIKLLLMIVCFVLDGIMQIPILKQINEVLGLILGVILGIIQVYTVLAVITFLSSFIQMPGLVAYIKSSLITSVLFEYNLIIALIF